MLIQQFETMDILGGNVEVFYVKLSVIMFLSISDDELCFDEQGVPICPAKGDYEELVFCCVKNHKAYCCSEEERLSYFTNIK